MLGHATDGLHVAVSDWRLRPVDVAFARPGATRPALLVVGMVAIAALHYVTDPSRLVLHEAYNYLCYVPIIFAAYWYGPWGGVAIAAVTAVLFVPHIRTAWTGNAAYSTSLYAQVVAFHVLGLTLGLLISTQRRLTTRYRDAAVSLEHVNRELRQSHDQLLRSDRLSALGTIAAGLAHELRTPLAGVKGALEIIASRVSPGTPEGEFAAIGVKELARLEGMLTEYLTYARPHDPSRRPTDVHGVVDRVVALLHSETEKKSVTLVVDHSAPRSLLMADADQLSQVLFNVVLNAIQATPAGGQVRINERVEPGWQLIDVIDDGPGFSPDHAEQLFEPFFTTKAGGTGLGLAISRRIVHGHGGMIEALTGNSRGTIFRIRLPLTDGHEKSGAD